MKRVILHGPLKELYPGEILLDIGSAAEAIRALGTLSPAFRPGPDRPRLCMRAVGFGSDLELAAPTEREEIHLVLDVSGGGGKGGGLIKILIGVVLVAVAIYTGGAGLSLFGFTISQGSLFLAGATMLIGGILELASPSPKINGDQGVVSKYFGSPANTVKIGTPIPILYGTGQIFGQYISMDIVTDQLVMVDAAGAPPPDFGPPTDLAASGFQTGITVNWTPNSSPHRTGTQLWRSLTSDFASAELIFDSSTGGANPAETHFNDDLSFQISTGGPNIPAWYWARSVSDAPGFSPYTPLSTDVGVTATTTTPASTHDGGGDSADNPGSDSGDPGDGSSSGESNGDGGADSGDGGDGAG